MPNCMLLDPKMSTIFEKMSMSQTRKASGKALSGKEL